MSEILSLNKILEKRGMSYVYKMLSSPVVVTEKISAVKVSCRLESDNTISIFKRNSQITLVDRVFSKLYEYPIQYINSLPRNTIRSDYHYYFRYFHSHQPAKIKYEVIPTNGLILTGITKYDSIIINEISLLDKIANKMGIDYLHPVFVGAFDKLQIDQLIELCNNKDELTTRKLYNTINPNMTKTVLGNSLDSDIDSIIFRFEVDGKFVYAKLGCNVNVDEFRESKDVYSILLKDAVDYLSYQNLKRIHLSSREYEERFLELICYIFNSYYENMRLNVDDFTMQNYPFADNNHFQLNFDLIPNLTTIDHLQSSEIAVYIFRLLISTFYYNKRKSTPLLNDDDWKNVEETRMKIENICKASSEINQRFPSFKEYLFDY